jgi:hypothetical protein
MAPKKTTKKKTTKKKKSTKKKTGTKRPKRTTAGTDNIKSFMKMAEDMETAVYGFAGELRYNKNTEITPTQLLTQSLKYLKCYAQSNSLNLASLSERVSAVEGKDYGVTSAEEIKRLNKLINEEKKLNSKVNKEMNSAKKRRSAVRSKSAKKAAKKKSLKAKTKSAS